MEKGFKFPPCRGLTVRGIKNNTFFKFLSINNFLEKKASTDAGINRIKKLEQELSANWNGYTLLQSFQKLYEIREQNIDVKESLQENLEFFEKTSNIPSPYESATLTN